MNVCVMALSAPSLRLGVKRDGLNSRTVVQTGEVAQSSPAKTFGFASHVAVAGEDKERAWKARARR